MTPEEKLDAAIADAGAWFNAAEYAAIDAAVKTAVLADNVTEEMLIKIGDTYLAAVLRVIEPELMTMGPIDD